VSVELSNPTSVQSVFSDLRGAQDEFANSFSEVFDQLESLSLELFARHKCLELSSQRQAEQETGGAEHERQVHESLDELRELASTVRSAHEESAQVWSEISATHQQFVREHAELHESQEEMRRIGAEFRAMREDVERERAESRQVQASIQEHLQRLASVTAEALAAQPPSGQDEQLSQVLEATRQQQAAWQQDRAGLEAELEAERQRAAQQNEDLAEQRRLVAQQQAELAGELKRMRSLLEVILNHMNRPSANAATGKPASSSSEDAALGSVLAQFEMLQRDLAQRRADGQKSTVKG